MGIAVSNPLRSRWHPLFIQGPNDDPWQILRTLERTVGSGNFEVVLTG